MRRVLAVLAIAAAPAAAQIPARSVTFDAASAFDQRYRASVEGAVLGQFTIGLGLAYAHEEAQGSLIRPPCLPDIVCQPVFVDGSLYRAVSVDLAARWYPAPLQWRRGEQKAGVYLGEFVGFHHRTLQGSIMSPPCPPEMFCTTDRPTIQRLSGLEPGAEIGIRLMPTRRFIADVGGRFRLATMDDAYARLSPGDVDARFVIGLGLAW